VSILVLRVLSIFLEKQSNTVNSHKSGRHELDAHAHALNLRLNPQYSRPSIPVVARSQRSHQQYRAEHHGTQRFKAVFPIVNNNYNPSINLFNTISLLRLQQISSIIPPVLPSRRLHHIDHRNHYHEGQLDNLADPRNQHHMYYYQLQEGRLKNDFLLAPRQSQPRLNSVNTTDEKPVHQSTDSSPKSSEMRRRKRQRSEEEIQEEKDIKLLTKMLRDDAHRQKKKEKKLHSKKQKKKKLQEKMLRNAQQAVAIKSVVTIDAINELEAYTSESLTKYIGKAVLYQETKCAKLLFRLWEAVSKEVEDKKRRHAERTPLIKKVTGKKLEALRMAAQRQAQLKKTTVKKHVKHVQKVPVKPDTVSDCGLSFPVNTLK
jgi:hypothetical protein